jgi:hypothetical protein
MILMCPPNGLALVIRHPSVDPDEITRRLGLTAQVSWKYGDQRLTPKGAPLGGSRTETYWCHRVTSEAPRELAVVVSDYLVRLSARRSGIEEMMAGCGRIELDVSLYGGENAGEVLSSELLGQMHALGVGLGIEVFPTPQRGRE